MTHTSTEQPEAMRLAAWLRKWFGKDTERAAQELEYMHARVQELQEQLKDAQHLVDFYKPRCDLLQSVQSNMRDPERTVVCDILANGQLLHGSDGQLDKARYAVEEASQAQRTPLTEEQALQIFDEWMDGPGEHLELVRSIERAHGITQEKQG